MGNNERSCAQNKKCQSRRLFGASKNVSAKGEPHEDRKKIS